jgi:hypothetical protein
MTGMDANRRLAELQGWTGIFNAGGKLLGLPPGDAPKSSRLEQVPDWTGDWSACGPLMVQFIRRARFWPHRAVVGTTTVGNDLARDPQPGEGEGINVRRLIVDAAIAELEARR